jgi:hypothetical protein
MVAFNFDATNIAPFEAGLPVWLGRVPVTITKTEIKDNASNDGQKRLVLHVTCIGGHYRGQANQIGLNLFNHNPQAVEMAQRQLSSIAHIGNKIRFQNSDELIGIQFLGTWVKQEGTYTDQKTGQVRQRNSSQCQAFDLIDGRTLSEAMGGRAAANSYHPDREPLPPADQPAPAATGGFTPPPAANSPQGGFAPPMNTPPAAPNGAPGQPSFPQAPAAPVTSTAGFTPPNPSAPPAGGFGGPGAFAAPQGAPPAPQGFAPPFSGPGAVPNGPAPTPGQFAPPQAGAPGQYAPPAVGNVTSPSNQYGGVQPAPAGQPQGGFAPPQPGQGGPGPWGPQ